MSNSRARPRSIYDKATGWYFVLRLEEELSRATRYHLALTVVTVLLRSLSEDDSSAIEHTLSSLQRQKLGRSDIPAILNTREMIICLTYTNSDQAQPVIARLARALARCDPFIGNASYPDDASEPAALIRIAATRAGVLTPPRSTPQ